MLTPELVAELNASIAQVNDKARLSPQAAGACAGRILELVVAGPHNRAQFITLAAVALAGAEACRRVQR